MLPALLPRLRLFAGLFAFLDHLTGMFTKGQVISKKEIAGLTGVWFTRAHETTQVEDAAELFGGLLSLYFPDRGPAVPARG